MQTSFSKRFKKQYQKSPKKIKTAFDKRYKAFIKNPENSILNKHSLKGSLLGYYSINVTGDWRAIYSQPKQGLVVFEALGTHSQLYG